MVKIHGIVVVNGTKRGIVTDENESQVFVEPYPSYIPMSPDEPVDPDKIGGWHKKEDVVPLAEHIESLKFPKEELEMLLSLQNRPDRYLTQEEFDRIILLQSRQYSHHCMNPRCEGGYFPEESKCPKCGRELYV